MKEVTEWGIDAICHSDFEETQRRSESGEYTFLKTGVSFTRTGCKEGEEVYDEELRKKGGMWLNPRIKAEVGL